MFLLERKRSCWKTTTTAHQQITITAFFVSLTPFHATSHQEPHNWGLNKDTQQRGYNRSDIEMNTYVGHCHLDHSLITLVSVKYKPLSSKA